jgi:hypothetical protein
MCKSPLTFWVRIALRRCMLNATLWYKFCQWLVAGRWFSLGTPLSSTNKSDSHDVDRYEITISQMTIYMLLFTEMFSYLYHCLDFYRIWLYKWKHSTICVGHNHTQTNTHNANKTCSLLQTTGGSDELNIFFKRKW